eukprot:scaffold66878_cov30-Tisochrysis_lutea.AAC.3
MHLDPSCIRYRRADGVVVLYFTELSHTVPNEQFEYLADLYAQQDPNDRHPVIFIQASLMCLVDSPQLAPCPVTRDDPMQAVLCSQRGVTAFPQVEVWRDGVRRSCLDGLAGVMRLPEVLSDLGVSASASSSNRIQTGRSSKAPPTRADGSSWSQW